MKPGNQTNGALRIAGLTHAVSDRPIFTDLEFTMRSGESVAVVGPSGSGKTTLLMCLLGLIKPSAGRVEVAGADITRLSTRALAAHRRRHLGVVFQFGELLPELTPLENVALPALLAGMNHQKAYASAERLLGDLGVPKDNTTTGLLSGGERQRTAVARALISEPAVLLADEPTGALDWTTRDAVASTLYSLARDRDCALLVVTHDPAVAGRADRRLRLDAGKLTEVA
ncbi:ABC transporter ATP-binding protein [Actinomadura spongiicola]|uniref:ABC transporter ATP-binding protein n=1 Tax=Actinomadura spongiicola TaxID=2303421 RepID=A0A372GLV9_9ACTN|nr:ABC transporter ATP-binding protein [Actinomadura spongiicola]RFS86351.1 ABC transporter ATP-binding protein [Actinomadura spongiicola]